MGGFSKFLVGGVATSLLAWGAHALTGEQYIAGLESKASGVFSGLDLGDGASLAMAKDPLARIAVVTGISDTGERERVRGALMKVPGVAGVRFEGGDADADDAAGADASADGDAIASCQAGVDKAIEGKVINFRSGSAYMADDSVAIVNGVADALKPCEGTAIAVGGHTDSTGSDEINKRLSQARADVVKTALTERGVAADRITATGYGSSQPMVEGDGANAANRRIEFTLSAAGAVRAEGE